MKILNKKEFMKLKTPIVFSHYEPCIIEGLFICEDNFSLSKYNDFIQASLLDEVIPLEGEPDNWSSGDVIDLLRGSEINHTEFKLDLECNAREGLYDDSKLYIVYDEKDVIKLADRLLSTIKK